MKRFLLLLCVLCATGILQAATEVVDTIRWTYSISGGEATLGSQNLTPAISKSTSGAIDVPSTLGGCPVTAIGAYAFDGCANLTAVSIPEGVVSISETAFTGCSSLEKLTISSTVTSVGGITTFLDSQKLKFEVAAANPVYASKDGGLFSRDMTVLLRAPGAVTTYSVPSGVKQIESAAFAGFADLTSVNVPGSLRAVGAMAFSGCPNLYTDEDGIRYESGSRKILIAAPKDISGEYTVPNSVQFIHSEAFFLCCELESVTIPEGVKTIGMLAFSSCPGLKKVKVPLSVTSVESDAFSECVSLPWGDDGNQYESDDARVLIVASKAISGEYTIPKSVRIIHSGAFSDARGLTSVIIPSGVVSVEWAAFFACANLESVKIDAALKRIACNAFAECVSLTSMTIPAGVTLIEDNAFAGCSSLSAVRIPSSVTAIGGGAFSGCTGIVSIFFDGAPPSVDSTAAVFPEARGYYPAASWKAWEAVIADGMWHNLRMEKYATKICTLTAEAGTGGRVAGSGLYIEGTEATVKAVPDEGYCFAGWSGDVTSSDNPLTVTVTKDINLTASFTRRVTVTASVVGCGRVSGSGGYSEGTEVTLSAVPDDGYLFAGWSGDITSSDNPLTVTVTKDMNLRATFVRALTVTASVSGSGTVSGAGVYGAGAEVTLRAVSDEGYCFAGWSGGVTSSDNPLTVTVTKDMNLTATFVNQLILSASNEMIGPSGLGDAETERYVQPGERMTYTVCFENKSQSTAVRAAQVTNSLSGYLDWSTFEMGEVVFNNQMDSGLSGKTDGTSEVALNTTPYAVRTVLDFNRESGVITCSLRIVDPKTGAVCPDDSSAGILPPNDGTYGSKGYLTFSVQVRDDVPAGARIVNSASISFNDAEPIEPTPSWWNTVVPEVLSASLSLSEERVDEGETLAVSLFGGSPAKESSLRLYLTYHTAAAADLDLAKATIQGAGEAPPVQRLLRFPLTLTWKAGEIGNKIVRIPVKRDKAVEGDEFFTLQLAEPVNMTLKDKRICAVTIRDLNAGDSEASPYIRGLADPANGGKVTGSGYCADGKKVTLTAKANRNFFFKGWYAAQAEDPDRSNPEAVIAATSALVINRTAKPIADSKTSTALTGVEEDATFYALFEHYPAVNVIADEVTGKVTGTGCHAPGKTVTLRAAANKGYLFSGWDKDGICLSQSATYAFVMPESDVTLTARFIPAGADVAAIRFRMRDMYPAHEPIEPVILDLSGCTSLPKVTVKGLPAGLKFDAKTLTVTGTPTGSGVYSVSASVTTAGKQTASCTQTVVVRKAGEYALDIDWNPAFGKVTGSGVFASGKKVTLKATANKGYVFAGWYKDSDFTQECSSEIVDYRNPSYPYVTNKQDETFYARFVPIDEDEASLDLPNLFPDQGVETKDALEIPVTVRSLSLPKVTVKGLPKGVTYDAKRGVITGAAQVPGTYDVLFTLTNASKAKRELTYPLTVLNINELISDPDYQKDAVKELPGWACDVVWPDFAGASVKGLPKGLKWDASSGRLTGYSFVAGLHTLTFTKKVNGVVKTTTLTINVLQPPPPVFDDSLMSDLKDFDPARAIDAVLVVSPGIADSRKAPTIKISDLPKGLKVKQVKTGTEVTIRFTGTITASGVHTLRVVAENEAKRSAVYTLACDIPYGYGQGFYSFVIEACCYECALTDPDLCPYCEPDNSGIPRVIYMTVDATGAKPDADVLYLNRYLTWFYRYKSWYSTAELTFDAITRDQLLDIQIVVNDYDPNLKDEYVSFALYRGLVSNPPSVDYCESTGWKRAQTKTVREEGLAGTYTAKLQGKTREWDAVFVVNDDAVIQVTLTCDGMTDTGIGYVVEACEGRDSAGDYWNPEPYTPKGNAGFILEKTEKDASFIFEADFTAGSGRFWINGRDESPFELTPVPPSAP